jgi:hypothetical protein
MNVARVTSRSSSLVEEGLGAIGQPVVVFQ